MRPLLLALIALLLAPPCALAAGAAPDGAWTPTIDQVKLLESGLTRALPAGGLETYSRTYVGTTVRGVQTLSGVWVPAGAANAAGVHISTTGVAPVLAGEGCLINRTTAGRPLYYQPLCVDAGGWTPTGTQIADLENTFSAPPPGQPGLAEGAVQLIGAPMAAFPSGTDLSQFHRAYAGVTANGVRIIRGMLVKDPSDQSDYPPGVFIVGQAYLPLMADGGCNVIYVDFDPATNQGRVQCGGR